jgi:hypothetical protein
MSDRCESSSTPLPRADRVDLPAGQSSTRFSAHAMLRSDDLHREIARAGGLRARRGHWTMIPDLEYP